MVRIAKRSIVSWLCCEHQLRLPPPLMLCCCLPWVVLRLLQLPSLPLLFLLLPVLLLLLPPSS